MTDIAKILEDQKAKHALRDLYVNTQRAAGEPLNRDEMRELDCAVGEADEQAIVAKRKQGDAVMALSEADYARLKEETFEAIERRQRRERGF